MDHSDCQILIFLLLILLTTGSQSFSLSRKKLNCELTDWKWNRYNRSLSLSLSLSLSVIALFHFGMPRRLRLRLRPSSIMFIAHLSSFLFFFLLYRDLEWKWYKLSVYMCVCGRNMTQLLLPQKSPLSITPLLSRQLTENWRKKWNFFKTTAVCRLF